MKIFVFISFLLLVSGCYELPPYPEDNLLEELTEAYIKDNTGVNVDLSPNSPEDSSF